MGYDDCIRTNMKVSPNSLENTFRNCIKSYLQIQFDRRLNESDTRSD